MASSDYSSFPLISKTSPPAHQSSSPTIRTMNDRTLHHLCCHHQLHPPQPCPWFWGPAVSHTISLTREVFISRSRLVVKQMVLAATQSILWTRILQMVSTCSQHHTNIKYGIIRLQLALSSPKRPHRATKFFSLYSDLEWSAFSATTHNPTLRVRRPPLTHHLPHQTRVFISGSRLVLKQMALALPGASSGIWTRILRIVSTCSQHDLCGIPKFRLQYPTRGSISISQTPPSPHQSSSLDSN